MERGTVSRPRTTRKCSSTAWARSLRTEAARFLAGREFALALIRELGTGLDGLGPPGFSRFADEDQVVEAMKAAGYDEALLYERKLITLTKMEKDFGKKVVGEVLKDLIVKPQGCWSAGVGARETTSL